MPSAKDIAAVIPGATLHGDPDALAVYVDPLSSATPESLSWMKGVRSLPEGWNGGVVIACSFSSAGIDAPAIIYCENPRLGLALALQEFWPNTPAQIEQHYSARVDETAIIGQQGNSVEWDGKKLQRIPPQAGVIVCRGVYVGAYVTIVRGVLEDTVIGEGSEICNHVNIGHGVVVGAHCVIAPFTAIGGSTEIGDRVTVWQGARIKNGVKIGDGATIGQAANVIGDVEAGATMVGNPARRLY